MVIKNTATNELRRVSTDDLQFTNNELPINLIDDDWRENEIESGEYIIRQTDVLDNNLPVEMFVPNEGVIMRPVLDAGQLNFNAMDTTGGKRRKSRRRSKRTRSSKRSKKGRKSRRHKK